MKKLITLCLSILLFSCSSDNNQEPQPTPANEIRAVDVSFLPLIESEGTIYKKNNTAQDALLTLKNAGCNYIRVRLWHSPTDGHSGFTEVKDLVQRIRQQGMKVWLTVHYSDTWADPGNQTKPVAWQSFSFAELKAAVASYTTTIMNEINPDIIQIGNETNDGMLWPEGKLSTNETKYIQLVQTAVTAVRNASSTTKIMLHFAGTTNAEWYFEKVSAIDYDYIGLSYYPVWHGKSLTTLNDKMVSLSTAYNKKVLIAETAYPFTLNWNDWTNNIVGLDNQLITEYTATAEGQKAFITAIRNLKNQNTNYLGFCYWGAEWVAFRGTESTNGSSWENQALWDFNFNALPVMDAFSEN